MQTKKSQTSLEFLIVFGIAFTMIVVMSSLFFGFFKGEKTTLDMSHLEQFGSRLMYETEKVYFLGNGNRKLLTTKFPDNIVNMSIHHYNQSGFSFDRLNITYYGRDSTHSVFFEPIELYIRFNCTRCHHNYTTNVSYYNDSSFLSEGSKRIQLVSYGNYVSIDFLQNKD